jgi:hypothetical protein
VGLRTDHATLLEALIRTVSMSFVVILFLRFRVKFQAGPFFLLFVSFVV